MGLVRSAPEPVIAVFYDDLGLVAVPEIAVPEIAVPETLGGNPNPGKRRSGGRDRS